MNSGVITRRRKSRRRGATIVETAIILPVTILMSIGLIIGIMGVFRYNQISSLASEAARWAAVRGRNYEQMNRVRPITSDDVWRSVVKPRAEGLDLNALSCDATWNANRTVVSVKVTYAWVPEGFFVQKTLSCTATSLVSN